MQNHWLSLDEDHCNGSCNKSEKPYFGVFTRNPYEIGNSLNRPSAPLPNRNEFIFPNKETKQLINGLDMQNKNGGFLWNHDSLVIC